MLNSMKISIVIPVYNEGVALAACLRAISVQTVTPYEVIVVDNNSTDDTINVALKFPFVRVIKESKQGVVHARNKGFNTAKGDIIARIDADTIMDSDWLSALSTLFVDIDLAAISGSVSYHDLPWPQTTRKLELFCRQRMADGMANEVFLQGANMGIRRSAWKLVRASVCETKGIHEDIDLAIHLNAAGLKVVFDKHLHAGLSIRRFDSDFDSFREYMLQTPKTYAAHGRISQRHMYPVIVTLLIFYWPIKLIYRGYDARTDKFSLSKLLATPAAARVNPASYVD